MHLEFVRLLQVQRDLYRMPRGMDRFRAYLRTMTGPSGKDLELPLVAMNPMGKDHVPALLDRLLELDADEAGEAATSEARADLQSEPGRFKVGLVMADDAHGGWTNRYDYEFGHRIGEAAVYKRGWIVGLLWTSEEPARAAVREEVLTAIYRAAYIQRHGLATSLASMLEQEGIVMAMAGCTGPRLEPDDLEYTRDVIEPLRKATDQPTLMACLFGDEAAAMFGYRPQGLSPRAGLALALQEAQARPRMEFATRDGF
jgi:hypothetical protein